MQHCELRHPPPQRPMSKKGEKSPLEAVLRDVEAELRNRLRDACEAEANGVSTESSAEIRRLEDSLLAAAVAAEQTIALRRHIDRGNADMPQQPESSSAMPNDSVEEVPRVREFRDTNGQLWRAWPVTPGQARPGKAAPRYLGEFHKGWICFEALEGSARRRLPKHPEDWAGLQEAQLCQLLEQAINAPQRKPRSEAHSDRPVPPVH